MADEEHTKRIIDRATSSIADVITRYRSGDLEFGRMVGSVEMWIKSLIGVADAEWVEEWRSHWNRLEFVNASVVDEGRVDRSSDEREMSEDAVDALDRMTRR